MADAYKARLQELTARISQRSIDPDLAADCHAFGGTPITAWALRRSATIAYCGHHLISDGPKLKAEGWEIIPVRRTVGAGVGTEATPAHFAGA